MSLAPIRTVSRLFIFTLPQESERTVKMLHGLQQSNTFCYKARHPRFQVDSNGTVSVISRVAQTRWQRSQQGLQQERQAAIASLMWLRFGIVNSELQAAIPALMNPPTEEYTQLS